MVLEKTLESSMDSKEIPSVCPEGNQPWIFIGSTDAEAPRLWPPDAKSQLIGKDPDSGKEWGKEEKGATEDEIVGWHHLLNTHEFKQTLGDSEGHGSLACCMQSMEVQRVGRDWATEQQQQIVRKQKQIQATDYPTAKYNFRIFSHQNNGCKTADTGLTYGYTEVQLHCLIQIEGGLSISGNKRYSNKLSRSGIVT